MIKLFNINTHFGGEGENVSDLRVFTFGLKKFFICFWKYYFWIPFLL